MRILAIESSCDDTAASVFEDGRILSSVVASQDALHAAYGGVVPELAARQHLEAVSAVLRTALKDADSSIDDCDAIAVTHGPGLLGSLLVGVGAARGLALTTGLPLLGINHLEGHALSPLLVEDIEMPFLSAVFSGGHSTVYLVRAVGDYVEVASTRDDSAGEAFDKGAKMLGLGYPGGRVIDETARTGDHKAFAFPRGRVKADRFAMSFSGLKTSLWQFLTDHAAAVEQGGASAPGQLDLADVCASFQEAVVDVLIDRIARLTEQLDVPRVAIAGGVAANSRFRARMAVLAQERGLVCQFPPLALCTDNAAMIANAAWRREQAGLDSTLGDVRSRLPLGPRLDVT